MNINEAVKRHETLKLVVDSWAKQPVKKTAIVGAWEAITSGRDNGTAMASAVRLALPLDYIPLFRTADGVPAVYFVDCLSTALADNYPSDTDISDPLYCARMVESAVKTFEERRKQADSIEEGFGVDRSASWATLRKCDDMSTHVAARMAEIAKLAGRMFKRLAYDGMPKPSKDLDRVTGIEGGDDVARLLDEEVAMLNVEGANADMLSRLEDRQALQLQMTGETPHGRGPLVIALDESGSMHEQRQIWSKAAAVALARVALNEGRRVRVVHFAMSCVPRDLDLNDADSMRELAWSHLGGGTSIETAIAMSVQQVIELENEGTTGADIVFITDGEDTYSERSFLEMKKRGIQLWTVAIEIDLSKGHHQTPYLATHATKYLHLDDRAMSGDKGLDTVAELKTAALDNDSRGQN